MNVLHIIQLIRPLQWTKNAFVFIPLFFSGKLMNPYSWIESIIVFFCFSFVASGVYCLNDLKDVESDRLHPKKRFRPIASGKISVFGAWTIMLFMISSGFCLGRFCLAQYRDVILVLAVYLILNILYCMRLKRIAIVDVFIVSAGFVLRVLSGGFACQIWVSPWLICMTFLLALFLSFAKRRDDVVLMENTGVVVRKNIMRYNLPFLNQTLGIIAAVTLMSYIMYTISPEVIERLGSEYIFVSAIFVLAGILRYLQVTIVDLKSGSPTKILLKDRFIQTTILCWTITFLIIIYF